MFSIRPEQLADRTRVFQIHEAAFRRPNAARLLDQLREATQPHLSLVAVRELTPRALAGHRGRVVFHPAFAACE